MTCEVKAVSTIAGLMLALAMPAAAQTSGPPVTAFDGAHAGVSAHIAESTGHGRQCPREHAPDSLTITNGAVHSSVKDRWTGTVGAEGYVTLRNRRGMRVDAQIDAQGAIKGRYQGPACFVDYVWHKRGA